MNARRIDRLQNLAIVLLTLSAVFLFASLPLFGPLSDQSLLALARDRLRRETAPVEASDAGASHLALPVRMVYTSDFARLGVGTLTTLSDAFERAGAFLGEAVGSAGDAAAIREPLFLAALREEGLYFTAALPGELLANVLGVDASALGLEDVRRLLLSPGADGSAALYAQDGGGQVCRYTTAVSVPALVDFLASQSGSSVEFAFLLGPAYNQLSPYTILSSDDAPHLTLGASNALGTDEDAFLRRSGFNAHAENRFTESSGTVIVREVSSSLYLRPDGTVEYQGAEAAPDSIYFVPSAVPGAPTLTEAAVAAQTLCADLLQDSLGSASLYLSEARDVDGRAELCFDLLVNDVPIRYADGSHAVAVTVEGNSVTAFSLRARRYVPTEDASLLLPFSLSAAIARVWNGAELLVAYVDAGSDTAEAVWIAE